MLISGGSRGLGLAIVNAYLERGAAVATFARRRSASVEQLTNRHADRFLFRELDALDSGGVESFVRDTHDRFGRIDFLVNNAAMGQDHLLAHMAPDLIRQLVEINVLAPILLTRLVVKRMLLQGSGRIVNISSICGSRGFPGLSVYSATKGALDAFARSLGRELGGRGGRDVERAGGRAGERSRGGGEGVGDMAQVVEVEPAKPDGGTSPRPLRLRPRCARRAAR